MAAIRGHQINGASAFSSHRLPTHANDSLARIFAEFTLRYQAVNSATPGCILGA